MIKFFRRIRKRLLTENKFSKYILYAIGEIVLVVIGILIALSINNWNERKKNTNLEKEILQDLLSELEVNQQKLIKAREEHFQVFEKTSLLVELIEPMAQSVNDSLFNAYMGVMIWPVKYIDSKSIISTLVSSGSISLIASKEIRYKVSKKLELLDEYNYLLNIRDGNIETLISPYIIKYHSFRNLSPISKNDGSRFTTQQISMLRDIEFETIVELRRLNAYSLHQFIQELDKIQKDLIALIKKRINDQLLPQNP